MSLKPPQVDSEDDPPPRLTRKTMSEAAEWVARLHGPNRNREMELGCLAWQARSAANRYAFERCTEVWMEVPNAAIAAGYVPKPRPAVQPGPESRRMPTWATLSVAVVLGAAVVGWMAWPAGTQYLTEVGAAQTVVLADGTRMFLNTDTRVRVELGARQRTVSINGGEVVFEVAKDVARPFVVRAAGSEVIALGTAFSVRLVPAGPAGETLAVTLLEGQVALRPRGGSEGDGVAPSQALVLRPGDRVRLAKLPGTQAPARQQLDRPPLDQVTAWRRNEAIFDRTSLPDAVAEMNRYSRTQLVLVGDMAHSDSLVSGRYPTGDNAAFAKALAALHGLVVSEQPGRLELFKGS